MVAYFHLIINIGTCTKTKNEPFSSIHTLA